jgi:hypothetical protein
MKFSVALSRAVQINGVIEKRSENSERKANYDSNNGIDSHRQVDVRF